MGQMLMIQPPFLPYSLSLPPFLYIGAIRLMRLAVLAKVAIDWRGGKGF